jgi:protein-L-isoaspartate(D-aspartate) O-methyltransferase
MVEEQLVRRGIHSEPVLGAMGRVPRELFVPEQQEAAAYQDSPLPIAEGQTISQPYIVAFMLQAAELAPGERALEIGTGSGYAAAVMAEVAGQVFTMERQARLALSARQALEKAGSRNVEIRVGDGTLGWPERAPFNVIVATAGGREIPRSWKEQLAVGGRLVMPVGETPRRQILIKVTRLSDTEYREESLSEVRFVPLIGEQGWSEPEARREWLRPTADPDDELTALLRDAVDPLPAVDSPDFGAFFDRFANHRVVLLGEASHGSKEFYQARAAITRRLVEKHGFNLVAVEADWPDADVVDRYVRHRPSARQPDPPFQRFPTWMWRNREMQTFTRWLREHNASLPERDRVSFHGLDIYNLNDSISAVLAYLEDIDPEAARLARARYECLTPWQDDPALYGREVLSDRYKACEDQVVAQLRDLLGKRLEYSRDDGERFFDAEQNARLIATGERYYRAMYHGGAESWNLRDGQMFETLQRLLEQRGPDAKIVVWAHNSHIGDALATDMGGARGQINLGQLCREAHGDQAALIGFGTDHGTVAAASRWNGPMQRMAVRPARDDSYESLAHRTGIERFLLDLRAGHHETLRHRLRPERLERFIGVIYKPETERQSHYAKASLSAQFDAYVWFDATEAVTPLTGDSGEPPADTYPFGR